MPEVRLFVYVAIGGALGSVARFATQSYALMRGGSSFPTGTLLVNLVGAGLMGLLVGWASGRAPTALLFLGTGVLGGFTTYSAFNQETINLVVKGEPLKAVAYVAATLVGALVCGGAMFALGRSLAGT